MATLKNFGHVDNVTLKVMHGKHCAYVYESDEEGHNIFSKMVLDYITKNIGGLTK